MLNIVDVLKNRVQSNPCQDAVLYLEDGVTETERLSCADLDNRAKVIAACLQKKKLAGSCVMLLYPTGIDFITSLIGCWYAGVIAVPIYCPEPDEFKKQQPLWERIAADADTAVILTLERHRTSLCSLFNIPVISTDLLEDHLANEYYPVELAETNIAYLQYTSGSTALPKAAAISHGNLQHSLQETAKTWSYTKNSITLNWAPHTHVYGLVCGLLVPLYHGTLAIIMPPKAFINKPSVWLSALSKYRATHGGCPDFGYDLCVKKIKENECASLNLKHWKVAVNGGDVVHYETLTAFADKFTAYGFEYKKFCSAFGMSEVTGLIAGTPLKQTPKSVQIDSQRHVVSSGKLLNGLRAVAVDPQTSLVVASGETGEIWLSGKSVVNGYWRRIEENKVFQVRIPGDEHPYFRTGDLGFILDNELYLTGRLKEVIIVYGKKYYPLDLEQTISQALSTLKLQLPQVAFSTNKTGREQVIVVQELDEDTPQSLWVEIKERIRRAIISNFSIEVHEIVFVPQGAIPKTVSGKLQRKKAQSLFDEKKLPQLEQHIETSDIIKAQSKPHQFISLIAEVLERDESEIDLAAPLSRYALDSIEVVPLIHAVNKAYKLSISPTSLYEYATFGEFYERFLQKNESQTEVHEEAVPLVREQDIAIIGMSGVFPKAADTAAFWDNLMQGIDCISEVPALRWDWQGLTVPWGGFIDGLEQFDAAFFNISPREAELIDPQQRIFLQTVWHTIEDAGYTPEKLASLKTGLFVGAFNHDYAELLQNNNVIDAYLTTGTLNSMIANRISYFLNLHGPSETIDTACSSSLVAVHQAIGAILHDDCELAIAGGVNALVTPTLFISANKAGILSADGRCKTFDQRADGYVRGEGSGAILLKKLSQALADGDHIYGVIKGSAVNHGGHVNSLTAPNPNAQADVIVTACQRAEVPVESIDYIETHGTGTPLGDPIEINGLKKAFQQLAKEQNVTDLPKHYCGLGAVKTHIGHLESAAGIAGIIKILLAMHHEVIPANLHFTEQNSYIDIKESPFYVFDKEVKWSRSSKPRRAGVSSFGFGGVNAHVILEESPKQKIQRITQEHSAYLVALSASDETALQQRIQDLHHWLSEQKESPNLASLSYTLNAGRQHFSKRVCFIVSSIAQLQEQLKAPKPALDAYPELEEIAQRYLQGEAIDWQQIYGSYQQKMPLPVYPFAKDSYWLKIPKKITVPQVSTALENSVGYYHSIWIERDIPTNCGTITGKILVIGHSDLMQEIQTQPGNSEVFFVPDISKLTQDNLADYIVFELEESGYAFLLSLSVHLLHLKPKHPIQILCISRNKSSLAYAVAGFAKTLHKEQSTLSCRVIELSDLSRLPNELSQLEIHVRYDTAHKRLVHTYQAFFDQPVFHSIPFKQQGVYLITGGLGGIGSHLVAYLAKTYQARIILNGRSDLTPQHLNWITELENHGASLVYVQGDIAKAEDTNKVISEAKRSFGMIHGVIHSAGLTRDGLILTKTIETAEAVLAPKIQGTLYLHEATREEPLDFFVLFSSIAAVFGNAGQSDYAYANGFMDGFAFEREQQRAQGTCSGKTLSINWPFWKEGGLRLPVEYQEHFKRTWGMDSLETQQGLDALVRALQYEAVNCVVLAGNQQQLASILKQHTLVNQEQYAGTSLANDSNNHTEQFLRMIIAETLKCSPEDLDIDAPFEQYGIDSIMITELNQRLGREIPDVPKTIFFECQNLKELTAYFTKFHIKASPAVEERFMDQTGDIAIIGLSGRYPEAQDLNEFWQNLKAGKDCIRDIPTERWDREAYYDKTQETAGTISSKWGGFLADVDKFDPLFFKISPREAAVIDPQERLFLETAWNAIEDAGYAREDVAGQNVGVYVGVTYGEYQFFADEQHFVPTNSIFASIANRVSYFFDFHGPSMALDSMCSSSLTAIHLACQSLKMGECQLALAGGVNLSLHPKKYLLLSHANFLASDGHCRSFGEGGDGYVPGEGVGAVLLKPLDKALADGDLIYGVIKGSHLNHGGKTNGYTVPNPNAQAELIAKTYKEARVDPATVSYIEAHGTGTSLGDPIEIAGLNKVFASLPNYQCAIGSVKSNIGHCESAAGIAALTKVLLQLKHRTLVPSILSESLNSNINWAITPFRVQQTLSEWTGSRVAGISAFGAGGSNAHLIVTEAPARVSDTDASKPYYLLTLSAHTEEALTSRIHDLAQWIEQNKTASLPEVSYTLNAGRSHFDVRGALVVRSLDEALEYLQQPQSNHFLRQLPKHVMESKSYIQQLSGSEKDYELLQALAKIYVQGNNLDWHQLHKGEARHNISLPTYPFARERYWYSEEEPELVEAWNVVSGDAVTAFLTQEVMRILKINRHTLNLEKNLGDYGMDSVHFIELTKSIEQHYQIELPSVILYTEKSISRISEYLVTHYPMQTGIMNAAPKRVAVQKSTPFKSSTENQLQTDNHDIAIIGMHGLFPQSATLDEFWHHLISGHDLITEIPADRWDWRVHYGQEANQSCSKWGGFIHGMDQFDAGFFNTSPREANLMDPQQRLFLESVWQTIEDAGYDPFALSGQKVGVFAGVEFSEYQTLIAKQQKEFHGFVATGNSHSMIANRVSYFFNFQGPSEGVNTACSSSLVAIHRAVQAIRLGECDVALAGGVSLILSPDTLIVTSQLGALSADGRCKTFDKNANGYVKGEGVGSLLLKPLAQAQADGDCIYAIIKGSAVNHGGKAQSLTAPNASAQAELLRKAYQQAHINPNTISYIETHGTGTSLGDPIEIEGLKQIFTKSNETRIALGAVKTNIGHLEPAAGIAGMIKVILAMKHQEIPKVVHFSELNPYIKLTDTPFYIPQQTQAWRRTDSKSPLRAGVSSFGFGGTNAHIILQEGVSNRNTIHTNKPYLITLSAKHQDSLQQKIQDLQQWLIQQKDEVSLAALSFTLNAGKAHFNHRCALVVHSINELLSALELLANHELPGYCVMNEGQVWSLQGPVLHALYQSAMHDLNQTGLRDTLFILADLYTKNYPIDWHLLYSQEEKQRLASLPAYPFMRQRYWYDLALNQDTESHLIKNVTVSETSNLSGKVFEYLRRVFAETLAIAPEIIQYDETYEGYGVDSIMSIDITKRLEADFGVLPKTLLYQYNRIRNLANYFIKNHQEQLISCLVDIPATPTPMQRMEPYVLAAPHKAEISQDIAIIGLSGTFPLANTMDEFWHNLASARDCVGEVPADRWDYKDYPVVIGGKEHYFSHGGFIPDVDKFDPLFFNISPRDAGFMDPQERLFLQSAWSTLEDAGYTREKLKRVSNNAVGVFAGVTYNFYPLFLAEEWHKGNRVPLNIQSCSVANRVSYFLDVNGPSLVIDTACSSSLAAIHLACDSILRGDCVMAIAGGVNLSLHPCKYHFLGSFNFMSEQGRCSSFAEGGSGYVPSEGVGSVLLKPLDRAIADNDLIYGVIKGSSMNHGGKTSGYTVPNPEAQAEVVSQALKKATIDARTISYVEAHGTGTSLGDPIEIRGLQEAFMECTQEKQYCAIGSVKSNIGHLESAAGISQLAKVLLQMRHKQLVPSLHAEQLNSFIDFANSPFYVQRTLSEWKPALEGPRRAGISSFGAGGTNVHVIVEEYVPQSYKTAHIKGPFFFLLSALNEECLQAQVEQMRVYVQNLNVSDRRAWLRNACYTLQTGREHRAARFAVLVDDYEELLSALNNYPHLVGLRAAMHVNAAGKIQQGINPVSVSSAELIQLWARGADVDWRQFYAQEQPEIISLPTYVFAKRRCWIPTKEDVPQEKPNKSPSPMCTATVSDSEEWLYATHWERVPVTTTHYTVPDGIWLIIGDEPFTAALTRTLGTKSCITCLSTNLTQKSDYEAFFDSIYKDYSSHLKGIIYQSTAATETSLMLLYLFQSLIEHHWSHPLLFCLGTQSAQHVLAGDEIALWQHHLWSMVCVFAAEQANYEVLLLDLDAQQNTEQQAEFIVREISQYNSKQNHLAYRGEVRYGMRLISQEPSELQTWKPPTAALITGGLGALGYEVAKFLAAHGTRMLLLTGTTSLSLETEEKNIWMSQLRAQGIRVRYGAVDVTDKEKMLLAIQETESIWQQKIDGVFHLAGITTDSIPIAAMDDVLWQQVLHVKIKGALILHELFMDAPLNNFVLFSSIAAVPHFGIAGLSAYAVANEFMNGLAWYRRSQDLPAVSINWSAWSEKGMGHRYNHDAFLDAVGMTALTVHDGIRLLKEILNLNPAEITVCKIAWNKFLQVNAGARQFDFFAHFAAAHTAQTNHVSSLTEEQIIALVPDIFARILMLDVREIDEEALFEQYGLDSITGITYSEELGKHVPDIVSPMDLYRYPTIKQLTDYIVRNAHQVPATEVLPDLDQLNADQLTELLEMELEELELAYD